MGQQNDIVEITLATVASRTTEEGFGIPLVISYNATFPERSRKYSDVSSLVADGMAITSPEYLAANQIMSQNPHPPFFRIGRGTLKPTQVWTITPTVANTTVYSGTSDGVAWTFTSDGSATLAEICTGVAAAIDAVLGATFTVASTGTTVTITAATAGNWTSTTVTDPALLQLVQTHADPGIATDLAAIELETSDWYALVTPFASKDLITAAAAWVEARTKIYFPTTADSSVAQTVESGTDDVGEALDALNYQRTFLGYHHVPHQFMGAAWLGSRLWKTPGTEQWMFATLTGVTATPLTVQQKQNLDDKSTNGYYNVFGVDQTFKGVSAAGAPYFADYVRFRDKFTTDLAQAAFNAIAPSNGDKLPMDDPGLLVLKNALLEVCKRHENTTPNALVKASSKVIVPLVSTIPAGDRTNRIASGIVVETTYSNGVNKVKMTVLVSI